MFSVLHNRNTPVAGIFALTFFVYAASLGNGFVGWDDALYLYENPILQEFTLSNLAKAWTTYDPELYVPLTMLSYQINHLVAGFDPFIFHLTNLVFHAANAVLVFVFTRRLIARNQTSSSQFSILNSQFSISLFTALLFALHPFHTEAVAWASARKDVLVVFFYLLTLIFYLKYSNTNFRPNPHPHLHPHPNAAPTDARTFYWLSVLFCLLGFLSKVSIVTVPFVLILIDWWQGRKLNGHSLKEKWPYFALAIVFGLIALGGKSGNAQALAIEKLLIGSRAIVLYLHHIFWPHGLSVLYPYTEPIVIANSELLLSLLFVIALTVFAIAMSKRFPIVLFGWLFFLLTVLPSFTNVVHGQDLLKDIYIGSDRYAYMSSIGVFLVAATVATRIHQYINILMNRRPSRAAAVARAGFWGALATVIALLSFLTFHQSLTWRDDDALFTNVLRFYPNSHIAHNNVAGYKYNRGDTAGAIESYQKSLAIRPNASAYFNLGQISKDNSRLPEAIHFYKLAIQSSPGDLHAHINLGVTLMDLENFEEAERVLLRATEIAPASTIAYFNLGFLYEKMGRAEDALTAYERVLLLDPSDREVEERVRHLRLQ